MVLKKKSLFLISGIIFLLCPTGNLLAQSPEEPFNKGTELFLKLEHAQNDSAQYAHELYALAKYCRELGMHEESRIAAIRATQLMGAFLKKKEHKSEADYVLYEEELDMNLFLLDLLTGRGDQFLELSQFYTLVDASTTVIAAYRMADGLLAGNSQQQLRSIYQKWEFPRPEHLNILTRYYWETGQTDRIHKEIGKAQRNPGWSSLPQSERNELQSRMENACLMPYLSLSTLDECLRIAKSMYYPVSVKDILYAQQMPEYFSMYREAARTCVKANKPLYALKVYRLLERLILRTTENDYPFLSPSEQHNLWEIMQPYFNEMQTFVYQNRDLDGMASFLYHNALLMKELFAKPSFQYHRYLSDSNSTTLLSLQSKIDSISFDQNTFKFSIPEERMKWLKNEVLRQEYEKALIKHVRKEASPSLRIRQWNEIAASLDSCEAVIEIVSLPGKMFDREYIGIIFSKLNTPRIVTFPSETELLTMDAEKRYLQVWLPIKKILGDCTSLYISSEEMLNYFSFASIHHDGYYILDEYKFRYLLSGNDIPRIKSEEQMNKATNARKRNIHLFGGIDYNYRPSSSQYAAQQGFQYLQGTVDEVQSIERILSANQWNIHKYMGMNATDMEFRNLSSQPLPPDVIHVATHGVFTPTNPNVKSDAVQVDGFSGQRNLLLCSGLTFAGANHSWNEQSPIRIDDGILTAFEITSMDLSATDLVVLSGCSTGKGNVRYGEGGFGLQRAFRQTGVKSLILSYKTIADKDTKELMVEFYRNWQAGASKHQAFRKAQLTMKKKFPTESDKWAPFILIE